MREWIVENVRILDRKRLLEGAQERHFPDV